MWSKVSKNTINYIIMKCSLLYFAMAICTTCTSSYISKFTIVHEWGKMDFDYTDQQEKQDENDGMAPMDVDVYYTPDNQRKIFVTMPKLLSGADASLGTVLPSEANQTALIKPYPSWQWHENPELCKPDRLISIFRIKIDSCDRLWVLDTGRLMRKQYCAPQLLAFDLHTDQLIHRYEIPSGQRESTTTFATIMVDVRDTCENTFVYLADCRTNTIVVHDTQRNTSWVAQDKSMYPNPNYGTYRIEDDHFELMDGILAIALSNYTPGQDRKLFYHAMSSVTENWVYTSDLRNESLFLSNPMSTPQLFHTYNGTRGSQSATDAIDKNGILYFGQVSETTINCWNTATEYDSDNIDIVEYNPTTLQFTTGLKILDNREGQEELWIITTRYQKIWAGTLNPSEINFRIQTVNVEDALIGTKCNVS